jgi:transposase
LSDAQLELLEGEPGVTRAEVDSEIAQAEKDQAKAARKPRAKHPGRQELPAHLERREVKIPCQPEDCVCPQCQGQKVIIGYERSEELGVIPAHYFVKVTLREKRACPLHPEEGVACPVLPPKIIPKSKLSDEMIVDVLVKKYGDHLPAYRQSMILERDADIELSRKTLIGSIMRAGGLLEALIPTLKLDLFEAGYIQADETRMPTQSPTVRGRNLQAFLWEYSRPQGPVVFDFQPGRSRAGPAQFLKGFRGVLQTDGYGAYDKLGEGILYMACMAHVRREFDRAHKVQENDPRPLEILGMIGQIYHWEDQAREAGLDHEKRLAMRTQHIHPLMDQLEKRIMAIRAEADVLPASQLGKACGYAMGQWTRLKVYLEDGQVEIDNNWCENAIRPLAVGRKNWMHVGSEEAGPRVAAIASIFETCRRLKINVRDYLLDILPKLPEWPMQRVAELSPIAWKAKQPA